MKKNWKSALSLLFVLIFMLQIAGMTASADNTGASAPLSIAVYIPVVDENNVESSQPLDGETVKLPEGLNLELQLGDNVIGTDAALSLQSLMDNDLKITPPEGYYISELYIGPGPCDPMAQISLEGEAAANGAGVTLKKEKFVDDNGYFDAARLSSTGDSYLLFITLDKLEKVENVNVCYRSGDVDTSVPGDSLVPAGSLVTAASMSDVEGWRFTGWEFRYLCNGAEMDLAAGNSFQPYADCVLVAQWEAVQPEEQPEEQQPAHEHSWYETGNTATCTEAGVRSFACTGCDETYSEPCDALGHNYVAGEVVAPTVGAQGYTVYTCTRCNDSYNSDFTDPLPPHEHTWELTSDTATCEAAGTKTFTCSGCGDTMTEDSAAKGHAWDEGVETTPATCEHVGVKTFTCQNDPSHTRTEDIPLADHVWDDGVVTKPATCTDAGVRTYTCKINASHTREEVINALGGEHTWNEGVVDKEKGVTVYTCTRCGDTKSEPLPPEKKGDDKKGGDVIVNTPTELEDSAITPAAAARSWTQGSSTDFTFTVNYEYEKLQSVMIDGTALTLNTDFSAASGSTVITLKKEKLSTLSAGNHTVDVNFTDAHVALTLSIASAPVTKTDITVKAKDRTAYYTGENVTANEYEITAGALQSGDRIEATFGGGSVNVTTGAASTLNVVIKDAGGVDVTSTKYNVTTQGGNVVINPRPLNLRGQDVQKQYDGNAYVLSDYASRISSDKLANHSVQVSLAIYQNGSQVSSAKDGGSYDIMLTAFSVKDGSNVDVTANYTNTAAPYKLGTLTITNAPAAMLPVTVTAKSQTWTYDGQAHDCHEYTVSTALQDGDTMTVSFDAASTITDVGTVANKINAVTIKDSSGNGVAYALNGVGSGKYNVTVQDGTLKVDPFKLTLTAVSAEKYYDGTALRNDNVKASALISGHKFSVVRFAVTDSQGNLIKNGPVSVGTYTKKVTDVTILDSKGTDVTRNYDITKVDGTLKVMQADGSANTKSPKTGDENNMGLWIALLAVSAVVVLGVVGYFFYKNKKQASRKRAPRKPRPDDKQ